MNGRWQHTTGNQWLYVCEEVRNNMRVREIPVKLSRINWRWRVAIMASTTAGITASVFLLPPDTTADQAKAAALAAWRMS